MRPYTVYKHTSPSGKVYIGITSLPIKKRWRNGAGYKTCPAMSRAIEKYGWDQINHEILYSGLSKEEAEALEIRLISEHHSNDPSFGYNVTSGGHTLGMMPPETRQKMSASRMGHPTSQETKRKISLAHTGVPLSPEHLAATRAASAKRRGVPLPEETRRKISEANKGRVKSPEERQLIREIHTGRKCSEATKRKISETKKNSPTTCRGPDNHKSRPVVCVETEEVFPTVTEAAKAKNINTARNICRSCKVGGRCGGYHWRYHENRNSTK